MLKLQRKLFCRALLSWGKSGFQKQCFAHVWSSYCDYYYKNNYALTAEESMVEV